MLGFRAGIAPPLRGFQKLARDIALLAPAVGG